MYPLGAAFAIAAGLTIAVSMNVQRLALSASEERVRFLRCNVPKFWLWMSGLVLYGIGSGGLYAIAGLWIPLTLLTALYITLLVFNPLCARAINGDELTWNKLRGAAAVVLGVTLTAIGSPTNAPTDYTSEEIAGLFSSPAGAVWVTCLVGLVLVTVVVICVHEAQYPTADLLKVRWARRPTAADAADAEALPVPDALLEGLRLAPPRREALMSMVYPVRLRAPPLRLTYSTSASSSSCFSCCRCRCS